MIRQILSRPIKHPLLRGIQRGGAIGPAVPVNTVAPAITGSFFVGQTLTGSDGTWTNTPTGYTYQWYADGVAITGETANTYVVDTAEDGALITFGVIASNAEGPGTEAFSAGVYAIQLKQWLDASDTATITLSGSSVTQWNDKSGNANNVTQGTALNQPASGTRTINGLNVIDFDGSNDKLIQPAGMLDITNGNNTGFLVCATDSATKASQQPISGTNAGSTRYRQAYLTSGTQYEVVSGTSSVPGSYTVDTSPHILTIMRSNASLYGLVDGTQIAFSATGGLSVGIDAMAIGTQANSTANAFDGRIGEYVLAERNLSSAEATQVQSYLSTKWGISVSSISWANFSIAGFGDSITAGSNATTPANRWLNLVAASINGTVLNQGISGTVLQNTLGFANNGRDRYASALTGRNKQDRVYILYGLNDLRYTGDPVAMNPTNFDTQYREVIDGLLAAGYGEDDIYVGSPTWIPVAGYSVGGAGFTGSNETVNLAYGAIVRQIAVDYNLYYAPVHEDMLAYPGGPALLVDTDDIHPNNLGHGVVSSSFINATKVT